MFPTKQTEATDLHPLLSLFLVIYVVSISHSMMATIFVPMLMHPSGFLDEAVVLSTRTMYVGLLLALFPLGGLIGAPIVGSFADRYGRK